jgi:transposase
VKPIPFKLREAVLRARSQRHSYEEIAELLGIGRATVNRILRLHRETQSVIPRPAAGGNTSPIQGHVADLLARIVSEMSDATVAELTEVLVGRSGTSTSRSSVQRALTRLGFSRKKSPSSRWSATLPSTASDAENSARS